MTKCDKCSPSAHACMVTGTGGKGVQESRIWRHFLAYDYAYEGAVRVASVMACHASKEARGIIRGASLWCMCVRMPGLAFLLRGVLSLVQDDMKRGD